jgi:hypothetical protein
MSDFESQPVEAKPGVSAASSGKATASLICGLLSFCIPFLAGLVAMILGLLALSDIRRSGDRMGGKGLAIAGLILGCIGTLLSLCIIPALLLPAIQAAREAARRQASMNNMKMIGLGIMNYHDTHRAFPPRGVEFKPSEDSGRLEPKLGLSWRVRLLPYIEHNALYEQFDFDVPWDHPTNEALIPLMPDMYRSPTQPTADGTTVYLGVVYPLDLNPQSIPDQSLTQYLRGTALDNGPLRRRPGFDRLSFADITDGTSNTIAVVEADLDQAVIWTKPADWELDVTNPHRGLGGLRPQGFLGLRVDASVTFISNSLDDTNMRRLFCRNDGEAVDELGGFSGRY